jgi:hypothetical protein
MTFSAGAISSRLSLHFITNAISLVSLNWTWKHRRPHLDFSPGRLSGYKKARIFQDLVKPTGYYLPLSERTE